MRTVVSPPVLRRAPENELYDRGCDLVEAAAAIHRAAGAAEVARAIPAVLGCIEAALRELAEAAGGLEATTQHAIREAPETTRGRPVGPIMLRMHRGYENLRQALSDAERAAAAGRALAGRALSAAEVTRANRRRR